MRYGLFCGCMVLALPALAQTQPPAGGNQAQPVVITARQTLEWHRNDSTYIARGDVSMTQGDANLRADTIVADYRQTDSRSEIYRMTATDHVRLTDQGSIAVGDKAVYEVDRGLATLTGKALKLTLPQQVVTARDRMEYFTETGRANAVGQAHAVDGDDTIDADILSAILEPAGQDAPETAKTGQAAKARAAKSQPGGGRQLARLEAQGHVVIVTPTETLRGDKGDYEKRQNLAHLYGHVTIKRGPNILQGDSADIDLNTNISRMHAAPGPGGRVRGVFFPGTQNPPAAPATP